jgi:glycosyltransferase involved in cell wall biosynthesis
MRPIVADERTELSAAVQNRHAPCKSVLMVGTDPEGKGGIRSVVSGYLEAGLFDRFEGRYVTTHRNGGRWTKLTAALGGWVSVITSLRSLDTPLVHVQCSSRASFWRKSIVCLMARNAGRPYILHIHSGAFVRFYEESGPLARRYIRNIVERAGTVIALSEQWRERLLRVFPDAQIEVLSNALVPPPIDQVHPARERDPVVLYLGDISRQKGVHDLVAALAETPELRLVCGGLTPASGGLEPTELAGIPGVNGRISFPGWLGPESKRAALSKAGVFVLPSYAEGLPMALLEAMAWGIPVIATPVGGIPELITHGENGLLVQPGDVPALTRALRDLAGNVELREKLGRAARARIDQAYALDSVLGRLGKIYRRYGIPERI